MKDIKRVGGRYPKEETGISQLLQNLTRQTCRQSIRMSFMNGRNRAPQRDVQATVYTHTLFLDTKLGSWVMYIATRVGRRTVQWKRCIATLSSEPLIMNPLVSPLDSQRWATWWARACNWLRHRWSCRCDHRQGHRWCALWDCCRRHNTRSATVETNISSHELDVIHCWHIVSPTPSPKKTDRQEAQLRGAECGYVFLKSNPICSVLLGQNSHTPGQPHFDGPFRNLNLDTCIKCLIKGAISPLVHRAVLARSGQTADPCLQSQGTSKSQQDI